MSHIASSSPSAHSFQHSPSSTTIHRHSTPDKGDSRACARFRIHRKLHQRIRPRNDSGSFTTAQAILHLQNTVSTLLDHDQSMVDAITGLTSLVHDLLGVIQQSQVAMAQCLTSHVSANPPSPEASSSFPCATSSARDTASSTPSTRTTPLPMATLPVVIPPPESGPSLPPDPPPPPSSTTASSLPALRGIFNKPKGPEAQDHLPEPAGMLNTPRKRARQPSEGISGSLPGLRGRLL